MDTPQANTIKLTNSTSLKVAALVAVGLPILIVAFALREAPTLPPILVVSAIMLGPLKFALNVFVNKIIVDTQQQKLVLRRTFGHHSLSFSEVLQCKLVLVYVPLIRPPVTGVLKRIMQKFPYPRRVDFDAYVELTTAKGLVRYPLPWLDYKATRATETHYINIFEPLFSSRLTHTRVEISYYVTPWFKKKYWRYKLTSLFL